MQLIRAFMLAMSTYSIIPMPRVEWKDDALRHSLCFLPVVGAVIGALMWLLRAVCLRLGASPVLFAALAAVLPVLLSGGIHLDGYMDVCDALCSHQPLERRLEILKDPHVGAFSVIYAIVYMLVSFGLYAELYASGSAMLAVCICFVLSRALSALNAYSLPKARDNGMLFALARETRIDRAVCLIVALASLGCMAFAGPAYAGLALSLACLWCFFYRALALRQFGGATGDTAGFFLCILELLLPLGFAVLSLMEGAD